MESHVFDCKSKTEREEIVYGIIDLTTERANSERLPKLNRGHRKVENRSHYVRYVTFDEAKSQFSNGSGPQIMACLRHFAIGTLPVVKNAHRALELI